MKFGLIGILMVVALVVPSAGNGVVAAAPPDYDIPNGHFFSQAAGPGETGFGITDDGGVWFWSEFNRLGGVNAVGYPISDRFQWNGFTCQAMQRVVFQWRPEINQVYFVNIFDMMTAAGKDDWLLTVRQTPKPYAFDETGKNWDQIVNMRLAVLDANPAIKAAFFSVVGDPVTMNGLPTSMISDMGNNFTLRAQRVVIQQWKVAVPWAAAGQVTFALGGSIAKETGLLPVGSAPQLCQAQPTIAFFNADKATIASGESVTLSWGAVASADSASIDQGIGGVSTPGSRVVTPTSTTTYTLSATGCGVTVTKSVTITVTTVCQGPPTIAFFNADKATIAQGESATLSWGAVARADSASIDQGIGGVPTPGSRVVTPANTTTYTLSATGCGGTVNQSVTITVNAPLAATPTATTVPVPTATKTTVPPKP
jgi:hypothetical protein